MNPPRYPPKAPNARSPIKNLCLMICSFSHRVRERVVRAAAPAREAGTRLYDVGKLLPLPIVERLVDLCEGRNASLARRIHDTLHARRSAAESHFVEALGTHCLCKLVPRSFHLAFGRPRGLFELMERREDRLLLPRRRVESFEDGSQEKWTAEIASPAPVVFAAALAAPAPSSAKTFVSAAVSDVSTMTIRPATPHHAEQPDEASSTHEKPNHRRKPPEAAPCAHEGEAWGADVNGLRSSSGRSVKAAR